MRSVRLQRLGVLWNPNQPGQSAAFNDMQSAARAWKVTVFSLEARNRDEITNVLSSGAKNKPQSLLELPDPVLFVNRDLITEITAKLKLPTMYSFSEYVEAGGLMSYWNELSTSVPSRCYLCRYNTEGLQTGGIAD
jgi:ABC-type uncharacterized transport system substrate-binding protein